MPVLFVDDFATQPVSGVNYVEVHVPGNNWTPNWKGRGTVLTGEQSLHAIANDPVALAAREAAGVPLGDPNQPGWGQMLLPIPASTELWISGYVYFSETGSGHHIWRPYDAFVGFHTIQFDFGIPSWGAVQLFFPYPGGEVVVNTSHVPLKGQWLWWETHIKLGTQGVMQFYENGELIAGIAHGQPDSRNVPANFDFLSKPFVFVDCQSNNDFGGYNALGGIIISTERASQSLLPPTGGGGGSPPGIKIAGRFMRANLDVTLV